MLDQALLVNGDSLIMKIIWGGQAVWSSFLIQ